MKEIKFYKQFKLKKELPDFHIGTFIVWDYWKEKYTEFGSQVGINQEPKLSFGKEYVEEKKDWFEPYGEQSIFVPLFPDKEKLFDRDGGCIEEISTRHNSMCRICQLLHKIDYKEDVDSAIYNVLKKKYEEKFSQ